MSMKEITTQKGLPDGITMEFMNAKRLWAGKVPLRQQILNLDIGHSLSIHGGTNTGPSTLSWARKQAPDRVYLSRIADKIYYIYREK